MEKIRKFMLSLAMLQYQMNMYIFFIQFLYIHLIGGVVYSKLLLLFALFYSWQTKKNYFWYIGVIIILNLQYLTIINTIFGLLTCHQKWKFLIFFYVNIDFLLIGEKQLNILYHALMIPGILYQIYHNLPLKKTNQNSICFSLFISWWIYQILIYLIPTLGFNHQEQNYIQVLLIGLAAVSSYFMMQSRIAELMNRNLQNLENRSQFLHYIQQTKQKFKDELYSIGIQKIHRSNCLDVNCFCKDKTERQKFCRMYIRYLYLKGIQKFNRTEFEQFLDYHYIEHLIQQKMFPLAVEYNLKLKQKNVSIWKYLMKIKLQLKLREQLVKIEQKYENNMIQQPFTYQENYEKFKKQIIELLQLKTKYWLQLNKNNCQIAKLSQFGKKFLEKLNKMHSFYLKQINPIETQLKFFSGSIIYNLFLIVATNYKQLAQTNMKNLKKNNQNTISKLQKSHYKTYLIKISIQQNMQGIITNLSQNLTKLIGSSKSKSYFIGKNMHFLLPECYAKQHFKGLYNLRKYHINNILGIDVDPIFILSETKNIIPCSVLTKYSCDIMNQLSIVAFIKYLKNQNQYFLVNQSSQILYKSSTKTPSEIMDLEPIKTSIQTIKLKWNQVNLKNPVYSMVEPIKLQLRYQYTNYTCVLSSPLSTSFQFPQSSRPPIHISIHNQTQTYFVDNQLIDQVDLRDCLKKINTMIDHVQTESQSSNMSRKNQIVNILKSFQQSSQFSLFNHFALLLILLSIISISLTSVVFFILNFNWIDPQNQNGNKLFLLESVYDTQNQFNRFIGKGLSIYSINNNYLTNDDYSINYGVKDFLADSYVQIYDSCHKLADQLSSKIIKQQTTMSQNYFNQVTEVMNVVTKLSVQNFTFHSLLRIAIQDCYQISRGWNLQNRIIGQIYWRNIFDNFYSILGIIKNDLFNQLKNYSTLNLILCVVCCVIITLFYFPLFGYSKKLQKQDQYIFQLMFSIEPELIIKQIAQLIDLQMILRNNSISTFNQDKATFGLLNQKNQIQKEEQIEQQSHDNFMNKRKRNDQLNKKGYKGSAKFFYWNIGIFIMLLIGLYYLNVTKIETIANVVINIINSFQWQNQRIALLVNLKKYIFNYNKNELIQGLSIDVWLQNTIKYRKLNYPALSINSLNDLCNKTNPLCNSSTLNTQIGIDMIQDIFITQNFVDLNSHKIIEQQLIEQILNEIGDKQIRKLIDNLDLILMAYRSMQKGIYAIIWAFFLIILSVNLLNLDKMKKQYMQLIKSITFLSQQMIKKTKRVESFLQRLNKGKLN